MFPTADHPSGLLALHSLALSCLQPTHRQSQGRRGFQYSPVAGYRQSTTQLRGKVVCSNKHCDTGTSNTCGVIPWLDIKNDHRLGELSLLLSTFLGSLNDLHAQLALWSTCEGGSFS